MKLEMEAIEMLAPARVAGRGNGHCLAHWGRGGADSTGCEGMM